jgi:predicted alpha/beta-fold hydrolase
LKNHRAPAWLAGGHAQTIWPALYAARRLHAAATWHRERWTAPDGDFVDVDRQSASHLGRPLLVLFHGLEGSAQSHYVQAFADWATEHDIQFAMPYFRGCSGEINRGPRAYHSGDHEEVQWLLARFRAEHQAAGGKTLMAAGVSLGGNALMRWAGVQGAEAGRSADAVASICSPLDLTASGMAIGRGFNRQVYTRMFLRTMKPKALAKLAQHPGLFDPQKLMATKDLYEFDNVFTAPLHGFRNTDDYWRKASAKPLMGAVRIPALALNARNDPFIPASSLPTPAEVSGQVTLWQPPHGGHVGFAQGRLPGHVRGLPNAVGGWLLQAAGQQLLIKESQHG